MDPLAPAPAPAPDLAHPQHAADVPALVRRTAGLLHAHVPLTLLLDLAEDTGPRSAQCYDAEGGDASWLAR